MTKNSIAEVIDVSHHNGVINYDQLAGNCDGIIFRIGYRGYSAGIIKLDNQAKRNLQKITEKAIPFGCYFMSQAVTESEAIAEAKYCTEFVKGYELSYPIFYDSEYSGATGNTGRADGMSKQERTDIALAFCKQIAAAGILTGIYASKAWYTEHLVPDKLSELNIWVAQYNKVCSMNVLEYDMWQYTSTGAVPGVSGKVDMSHQYAEFKKGTVTVDDGTINIGTGIETYSLQKDGNKVFVIDGVKSHFKVKEFKCKDGSNQILIDAMLVRKLEEIRKYFGKQVSITSAYRTDSYNKKVVGATNSYHKKGQAADIQVTDVDTLTVAKYAEKSNILGIGLYDYVGGFVHVDTRSMKSFWKQDARNTNYYAVSRFSIATYIVNGVEVATIRYNDCNEYVKLLQNKLLNNGYDSGSIDGHFGAKTETTVRVYQKDKGLTADGVVGKNTWSTII